jgi:hypothetical protein
MFWKMSYADTSPIDTLLESATFTLEDLLDEDHVIQVKVSQFCSG